MDKRIEPSLQLNESDIKIEDGRVVIDIAGYEFAKKMKERILLNQKLVNELTRTHDFYLKSKNGMCAGVTYQILDLSSYGGKPEQ